MMTAVDRARFEQLDTDGDGFISQEEFMAAGLEMSEFSDLDSSSDLQISREEYSQRYRRLREKSVWAITDELQRCLHGLFVQFDFDGSGYIDMFAELKLLADHTAHIACTRFKMQATPRVLPCAEPLGIRSAGRRYKTL